MNAKNLVLLNRARRRKQDCKKKLPTALSAAGSEVLDDRSPRG